jgi:hypothetical protein
MGHFSVPRLPTDLLASAPVSAAAPVKILSKILRTTKIPARETREEGLVVSRRQAADEQTTNRRGEDHQKTRGQEIAN